MEKKIHYELEHFYPGFDRQKFWNLFFDHEAWSESEFLPGKMTIIKLGKDHSQGVGAVRLLETARMTIKEDIVAFEPAEHFSYATHNGSMPVNDFAGELFFEDKKDGLSVRYKGSFNPKYFGTGRLFRYLLRTAQKSAFVSLGKAYKAHYNI